MKLNFALSRNESGNSGSADDASTHELPLMYNWTEVERYDQNDLRLWLRGLRPFSHYEILIQAFNQFGKGPMAKAKATTLSDGETENIGLDNF